MRSGGGGAVVALALTVVACGQATTAQNAPTDAAAAPTADRAQSDLDESKTLARIANGAYRFSPQFIPINPQPYESIAASGTRVNVWVSAGDAPSYERISPEKFGSRVNLTPGAVIVREVIEQGITVKLTVIVKGPSGYNPDLGDLWFAVAEPNGTPVDVNGAPLTGRLGQCATCHSLRWDDGFLFGVPQTQRSASTSPISPEAPDAGIDDAASDVAVPPVSTPPVSTTPQDVCGDFVCGVGESCLTCPSDCGRCDDDHGGGSGGGPGPG